MWGGGGGGGESHNYKFIFTFQCAPMYLLPLNYQYTSINVNYIIIFKHLNI